MRIFDAMKLHIQYGYLKLSLFTLNYDSQSARAVKYANYISMEK